jgi:hypothetical protein
MKKSSGPKRGFASFLGNIALAMLGVGVALGLMELLLRTYPNLVPPLVRTNPPVRRAQAFQDETYDVRLSDGDLYFWMRGSIVPLPIDKDRVIARVHLVTDAYGFRNSLPEKATYGIVAVGDSYTQGHNVAYPWPQRLAEYTGIDVLNLGEGDTGPQAQLDALRKYGLKKRPQWVIMAYFEGNDLHDVETYDQANPFILTRFGKYLLVQSIAAWRGRRQEGANTTVAPVYRYPITVTINGIDLEMAFVSSYVAWLSTGRDVIESSQNYRIAREAILHARELSEGADARFLLVLLPSKEHVYLPYINAADTLTRVFADVPMIERDEAGFLQFTSERATPELTRQNMDDQARLLADFCAENQMRFLDLTPIFQEEAGTGAELYYPYDTHWNQRGQDLAAHTIAGYLESVVKSTLPSFDGAEVIHGGENGLLVEAGDVKRFVEAILASQSDPMKRVPVGQNAR